MTTDEMNQVPNLDAPFLPPIENPEDESLKQTYNSMQQQFGKVITPLKIHWARLPPAFLQWATKINELDMMLQLPPQTAMFIRGQVARLNVCLFCIDANRFAAMQMYKNEAKVDELNQYKTSPLFTEAERAALDYTTELMKEKKVNPATFARLQRYYSEREICEIVYLIASEHVYNMTNIGLNIHSDMLCSIPPK